MACFLSFVLMFPFALGQFLHFSHKPHHSNTARTSVYYSGSPRSVASAKKDVFAYDASVKIPYLYNKLSSFVVRQGLNGDPCSSASDCQGDRLCAALTTSELFEHCQPGKPYCFCFQPSACYSGSDCDHGEVCFDFPHSAVHVCVSEETAAMLDGAVIDDANSGNNLREPGDNSSGNNGSVPIENDSENNGSVPIESDSEQNGSVAVGSGLGINAKGLNGDSCSSKADCQGDRQCFLTSNSTIPEFCTPESFMCFCYKPDSSCSSTSDCDDGEVCFGFPDRRINLCLSEPYAAKLSASLMENEPGDIGLESGETEPTPYITDECSWADDCESGEECVDIDGILKCVSAQTTSSK